MYAIRPCEADERSIVCDIINAAAEAYRGVIPADQWHEPYMSSLELDSEISAGVVFWVCESQGEIIGVMGIQRARDVDLIRHAYVRPSSQRRGIGAALIKALQSLSSRQMLVGTWAAATWAIAFYQRHGFVMVPPERKAELLRTYWTIPERQVETSVVLVRTADD